MIWSSLLPFALFAIGVVAVIWATERLLEGLVGLARLLRVSIFAIAAILSGFEAENVAVGLADGLILVALYGIYTVLHIVLA